MSDKIPGWAGIILGPVVAGAIAFKTDMGPMDPSARLIVVIGAVGIGFVAGLIVWWKDSRSKS